MICVESEEVFFRPLRIGDWLSRQETVIAISEETQTRAGVGHFVTTRIDYYDAAGDRIAEGKTTVFRFTPTNSGRAGQG